MKRNLILLLASFLLLGTMYAQDQYTPVDPDQGSMSLQVWAEVQIDGVSQTSADLEVGMFLDDVCKDSRRIQSYYGGNFYRVKPFCTYDDAGQVITFKLYDHANQEELNCDYTATTTGQDMTLGATAQNCIVLNFQHEVTPTYDITVTADPTEGGTVSGGGSFEAGTSVTVTATPAEGYTFVNWTEDGTEVSIEASYTFEVSAARSLVAHFEGTTPEEDDYPWVPEGPGDTYLALVAIVQINGETITDGTNWELGAFAGTTCRGLGNIDNGWVAIPEEAQEFVPYTYYMNMIIRGEAGEEISFKLYDLEAGAVHPGVCDVTVTYQPDGDEGDYWDPVILNFITEQTFELPITGYTTDTKDHYYLIASPIGEVSPANVTNMISNEDYEEYHYDLFYFDQNSELEWINYKPGTGSTNPGFNLELGKGYLYANSVNTTLYFTGRPISAATYDVTLVKNAPNNPEGGFEGWNLVGNPFGQTAYLTKDFYVMNNDGDEIIAGEGNSIDVMQGIFVVADEDGETLTFSKEETPDNNGKLVLNMQQARGTLVDRAMVRFNANRRLPKIMLNEENTKLYIPQEGTDYAVVSATSETEEMPLNFKASENGVYTLSVASENVSFEHLTLIDHLTGAEVNLLATPNYQFNANTNDPAARFTILFRSNSNVSTAEQFNPICYRMDGQLTINGIEGDYELQVIDLLGRVISSTTVNGDFNQMLNAAPGVYSLRVITADKVYSQKIVVE